MKKFWVTMFSFLFLVALTSCTNKSPSENGSQTSNSFNSTVSTISPYQLRLNQSSSWVERTISNFTKTVEENYNSKNKSLYSSGETPATILACGMKRFEVAFASLPEYSQVIEGYEEVLEVFPAPAVISWIITCSGTN